MSVNFLIGEDLQQYVHEGLPNVVEIITGSVGAQYIHVVIASTPTSARAHVIVVSLTRVPEGATYITSITSSHRHFSAPGSGKLRLYHEGY